MSTAAGYVAGVDESGKGDFFGPLIIAAAAVSDLEKPLLDELYVRDSKKLSDNRAITVARQLKTHLPHSIVAIMPARYNELYEIIGNLNKLLAWGHARAIENLLGKIDCSSVVSDKFAREEVLKRALMDKGRRIELIQRVRGESELPVAAASILARAEFVASLQRLSKKWDVEFPKGASGHVDLAGKRFADRWGEARLNEVAKLHFKNLQKIRELSSRLL